MAAMATRSIKIGKSMVAMTVGIVAVPLIMLGVYFGFMRGDELARTSLTDAPIELAFTVEGDPALELWTELRVAPPFAFDTEMQGVSGLPHVLDYVIRIERDGQPAVELVCNPFAVHFFDWESSRGHPDHPLSGVHSQVTYLGRMDDCGLTVEQGAHVTVVARRRWIDPTWAAHIGQTDLIVRGPGVF